MLSSRRWGPPRATRRRAMQAGSLAILAADALADHLHRQQAAMQTIAKVLADEDDRLQNEAVNTPGPGAS